MKHEPIEIPDEIGETPLEYYPEYNRKTNQTMNLPEQIKQDPEAKKPSEVEKAQQAVDYWIKKISDHNDRIYHHEKELHFAKKNLKVHERSLKALIQLENEMKG